MCITLSYALFCFGLFAPPDVLLSSGLTLENIFRRLLGSEELSFTSYHLRRTALLYVTIGFLPLGTFIFWRLISKKLSVRGCNVCVYVYSPTQVT